MIPVSRPHYTSVEVDHILGEIRKVLSSGRLVNGPYLQDFENKFSEYIGWFLSTKARNIDIWTR